jgi:trigger factor
MQIEVTSDNAFARRVNVTVPASTVKSELERAYRTYGRRVRLPGFRKGKVPRRVIEAQFGPNIRADVAQNLIQRGYTTALTEHDLEPVSRPSVVSQGEVVAASDFEFTIALDVRPAVVAESYTGLDVYWPKWEVEESAIDSAVESRRQAQARLVAVDDRAVASGDMVQVELTAKDGDDVVLQEPGTLVRTEGDSWLRGLEGHLEGLAIDESKEAEVTFAADARNEDVAGKTLSVSMKVLSIQAMATPELTEELASEMGYDSIAAMRDTMRDQLSKGREEQARNQARANLLQALIDANPFEVPSGMVAQNLELLQQELRLQYAYAGHDPKTVQFSDAQLADLRVRAGFAAKGALLLEHVSTTENIAVTDDDVEAKLEELAAQRGQTVEALRAYFGGDDEAEELRNRILEEKTLDWLLEHSNVTHDAPAAPVVEEPVAEAPAAEAAAEEPAVEAAAEEPAVEAAAEEEAAPAAEEAAAEVEATVEIGGKTYSGPMVAAAGDAGSTFDQARAESLMAALEAGGEYGDLEKATMRYLRKDYSWDEDADKWFRSAQRKWAARRKK